MTWRRNGRRSACTRSSALPWLVLLALRVLPFGLRVGLHMLWAGWLASTTTGAPVGSAAVADEVGVAAVAAEVGVAAVGTSTVGTSTVGPERRDTPVRGAWGWPTGSSVVLRPFVAPRGHHGPGHRGLDVLAEVGAPVRAPADGVVQFSGSVGGRPVVTIDHGGGLVSTLDSVASVDSVVSVVAAGDRVERGQPVGVVGPNPVGSGHCGEGRGCLHLGARLDGAYVDPLPYLSAPEWPVLLPLGRGESGEPGRARPFAE